jgi:hypothetical protein
MEEILTKWSCLIYNRTLVNESNKTNFNDAQAVSDRFYGNPNLPLENRLGPSAWRDPAGQIEIIGHYTVRRVSSLFRNSTTHS